MDWALQGFELTPYKLNLSESLAKPMGDHDVSLCEVLRNGAPTGVRRPIAPSGIWPLLTDRECEEVSDTCDLCLCAANHASAEKEKSKVRELVQEELDQGYMVHIEGGLPAVQ